MNLDTIIHAARVHRAWYSRTVSAHILAAQQLPEPLLARLKEVTTSIVLVCPWYEIKDLLPLLRDEGWHKQGYSNGRTSHWQKGNLYLMIQEVAEADHE